MTMLLWEIIIPLPLGKRILTDRQNSARQNKDCGKKNLKENPQSSVCAGGMSAYGNVKVR